MRRHHRPVDTSVEISGRHDFAVRDTRLRQKASPGKGAARLATPRVHRISCPTFCDDRETPLMRAEDARKTARDLPDVTSEKVCGELARRANHARRRIPEHESQEPGQEPVIQCGRCMSALARIPDSNPASREVRKVPNSDVPPLAVRLSYRDFRQDGSPPGHLSVTTIDVQASKCPYNCCCFATLACKEAIPALIGVWTARSSH
jgi:hypothetical protein